MNAMLRVKSKNRNAVAEFLDDRSNDDRSQAHRLARNYEKCDLPSECGGYKAVVKTGMCNRRRIITSDELEHEKQRRNYQHAPNACKQKDDLGEFHLRAILR